MSDPPSDLVCYRRIGPFDAAAIPAGLLREHTLKAGVWGRVGSGQSERLVAPAETFIPPQRPHHVEVSPDVSLEIELLSRSG
ncbi:MAG: hypothetical protein H5U21_04880 [Porphyrobacter sp.]|nr:hypothetical protein [Porphyrobacter sp.]